MNRISIIMASESCKFVDEVRVRSSVPRPLIKNISPLAAVEEECPTNMPLIINLKLVKVIKYEIESSTAASRRAFSRSKSTPLSPLINCLCVDDLVVETDYIASIIAAEMMEKFPCERFQMASRKKIPSPQPSPLRLHVDDDPCEPSDLQLQSLKVLLKYNSPKRECSSRIPVLIALGSISEEDELGCESYLGTIDLFPAVKPKSAHLNDLLNINFQQIIHL